MPRLDGSEKAFFDHGPDGFRDFARRTSGIDDDAAIGFGFCDPQEGPPQSLMEIDVLALEPVGRGIGPPRRSPCEPHGDRQVENESEIWPRLADGDALERTDQRRID